MISKYTPEQIAHIKSYWYLCRYSFYILIIAFVVVGLIVLVEGYCPELKKKIEKMEHSQMYNDRISNNGRSNNRFIYCDGKFRYYGHVHRTEVDITFGYSRQGDRC